MQAGGRAAQHSAPLLQPACRVPLIPGQFLTPRGYMYTRIDNHARTDTSLRTHDAYALAHTSTLVSLTREA